MKNIYFVTSSTSAEGIGKYTLSVSKLFDSSKILYINVSGEKFSESAENVVEIKFRGIFYKILKYGKRRILMSIAKRIFKKKIVSILRGKNVWISDPCLYWLCKYLENCIVTVHDVLPIIPGNINYFSVRLFENYRKVPRIYKIVFNNTNSFIKQLEYLENASLIVVPSEYSKNELKAVARMLDINLPKIVVLPEPIPDYFRPIKVEKPKELRDKKIILHVGSDEPRKNVITILEALKLLPEEYIFVKIGSLGKRSLKFIRKNKLEDRVIFLGKVSEEELVKWYNIADVFVFPSLYEGFGLPPLEAMACGCPVIVSKRCSLPEICGDTVIYLDDPTDPKELSEKILGIFKGIFDIKTEKQLEYVKRYRMNSLRERYHICLQHLKIL